MNLGSHVSMHLPHYPKPIKFWSWISFATRSNIAVSHYGVGADSRIGVHQCPNKLNQLTVLGDRVVFRNRSFQLYANAEIIAATAPTPNRNSRMPSSFVKAHKLLYLALPID